MRTNYSRAERKHQIEMVLLMAELNEKKFSLTHYEIAKRLQIRPSTHLMKILGEMVSSGALIVEIADHRKNHWKRLYRLHGTNTIRLDGTMFRSIKFTNHRGEKSEIVFAQERLF